MLLGKESIDYPGDTPFSRTLLQTTKNGGTCDLSKLTMSAHSGTHIDTPAHFIPHGRTLDSYGVQEFIFPARVIKINNPQTILPSELTDLDIKPGEALLFKTDNSITGRCKNRSFTDKFIYLSLSAAEFCVEKKIKLVGIDYITIEKHGDGTYPVHQVILENDILVLEGVDLSLVPPGSYTLMCLPLKIKGGEASPVRAVLFEG